MRKETYNNFIISVKSANIFKSMTELGSKLESSKPFNNVMYPRKTFNFSVPENLKWFKSLLIENYFLITTLEQ